MNTEAFFFSFSFFLLRKTPFVCGSVAIMVWVMLPCGLTTKILSEKRKKNQLNKCLYWPDQPKLKRKVVCLLMKCSLDVSSVMEVQECLLSAAILGVAVFVKLTVVLRARLLLLLNCFSCVRLCATPWTAAHQAPPSMGFSRQEHWSGLPLPSPQGEAGESSVHCDDLSSLF